GPLTLTDMNVYLGRIVAERFPFPLDRAAVERGLTRLAEEVSLASARQYSPVELATGCVRIANTQMAQAIRSITLAKGCDARDYVLVPFGGAAGQHACAVAEELGIRRILHHPDAGLLSAFGIGLADHRRHRTLGVYRLYSPSAVAQLGSEFQRMKAEAISELQSE